MKSVLGPYARMCGGGDAFEADQGNAVSSGQSAHFSIECTNGQAGIGAVISERPEPGTDPTRPIHLTQD